MAHPARRRKPKRDTPIQNGMVCKLQDDIIISILEGKIAVGSKLHAVAKHNKDLLVTDAHEWACPPAKRPNGTNCRTIKVQPIGEAANGGFFVSPEILEVIRCHS